MVCVIVATRSRTFFKNFCDLLGPGYDVVQAFDGKWYQTNSGDTFILQKKHASKRKTKEPLIIVYREPVDIGVSVLKRKNTVAIVDAQRPELLEYVSSTGLLAITCGLSSRDTITLSSMDSDSVVVNIQRSIISFCAMEVEPQEFPVNYPAPFDHFSIMAAAGVFLACGQIDRLSRKSFCFDKKL